MRCHHLSQRCPLAVVWFNGESLSGSVGLTLSTSFMQTEAQEGPDLTRSPLSWEGF